LAPEILNGVMMGFTGNGSSRFPEIEPLVQISHSTLSDMDDAHYWQRWVATEQDTLPWARKATIRHSNRVELSSLQVAIPEDIHLLRSCLESCFPGHSIKEAARKLLISLQDDNLAITTSVKATSRQGNQLKELILPVRALVYFRSGLRPEDWQITRQVLCLLCSEKAIEELSKIAELSPFIPRSSENNDNVQYERFFSAINSLNIIGGTRSVGLALVRRQLSLKVVSNNAGSSNFEWSKFSPRRTDGVTGAELYGIISNALQNQGVSTQDHLAPYIQKKSCLYIIPAGNDQEGPPASALEIPSFRTQGLLVKMPKVGGIERIQNLCFLVINENVKFNDEAMLGQLLEESNKAREVFAMAKTNAVYEQDERKIIDKWILILKGHLPRDTPLE
jgi:hypothetical protein